MKKLFHTIAAVFIDALALAAEHVHAALFHHMHRTGLALSFDMPTIDDFTNGRVTSPGQSEIVRQRLFDWNLYPGAGAILLTFFSQGPGQGITTALGGVVGSGKSYWDTNQEIPNTLPSGKSYLIESIEVVFLPGSVSTANTYTPATVSSFNAAASQALIGASNDVSTFYQSGMLELNILSKNYLKETPLMSFPPKAMLDTSAGISSNSATVGASVTQWTKSVGRAYYLEPRVTLQPAVNFELRLSWPAVVAMPSGFNGRVGVYFDGYLLRASQ